MSTVADHVRYARACWHKAMKFRAEKIENMHSGHDNADYDAVIAEYAEEDYRRYTKAAMKRARDLRFELLLFPDETAERVVARLMERVE